MNVLRIALSFVASLALAGVAASQTATPFCFGDGTSSVAGGNCPCGAGQNGLPGQGCLNSAGAGAVLTAGGSSCISLGCGIDTLTLTASGMPPTLCILIQSATQLSTDVYFGDGIRCLGGNILRMYVLQTPGTAVFPPPGPSISARSAALGDIIPPGATRLYQVYYRDPPPAHCPPATFNATSGMIVGWR